MTDPKKPKRRAVPADTSRLKNQIAHADRSVRGMSRMLAESSLDLDHPAVKAVQSTQMQTLKRANAQQDTLNMLRKGVGHKSFAQNTEGFDGASLSDRPPRMSIPRGHPTPDVLPSATGTPALAQIASGTENIRAERKNFEAGNTRATSSSGQGTRAGVARFSGLGV